MAVLDAQTEAKFPGIDADGKRDPFTVTFSGPTTARPGGFPVGGCYFDTTLGKPIFWTGIKWVDSAGADLA